MDDRDRRAAATEHEERRPSTGTDPVIDQTIPPPDDGQLHSDLGLVSGGSGEEGNARNHQDG
jgi:hypothetical protein